MSKEEKVKKEPKPKPVKIDPKSINWLAIPAQPTVTTANGKTKKIYMRWCANDKKWVRPKKSVPGIIFFILLCVFIVIGAFIALLGASQAGKQTHTARVNGQTVRITTVDKQAQKAATAAVTLAAGAMFASTFRFWIYQHKCPKCRSKAFSPKKVARMQRKMLRAQEKAATKAIINNGR